MNNILHTFTHSVNKVLKKLQKLYETFITEQKLDKYMIIILSPEN